MRRRISTWALILGITRRLGEGERLVRAGAWKGWGFDFMLGSGLAGKVLGIVGGGRIGRAVASRASAFGMRVAVASRRDPKWPDVEYLPLERPDPERRHPVAARAVHAGNAPA